MCWTNLIIKMSNRIPDRWLNYIAFGTRVGRTPFVAFKCPLNETISYSLPPEAKFGLEEVRTQLPQVSLIIDLTNTTRYYNSKVLRDYGIEYEKIFVAGHTVPPEIKFNKFFHIVDNFIRKNKSDSDKLIGVHCTHGINRTGLFICSYMICKLGYSYESAVGEFNSSRGHSIERENYLEELKKFETRPLKFEFGSYQKLMKIQSQDRRKRIKPLMELPPPLLPQFGMPPKKPRFVPNRDRIRPLMGLPPPEFQHTRDPRPLSSFNIRPSSLRPSYVSSSYREPREMNRPWRNYSNKRR